MIAARHHDRASDADGEHRARASLLAHRPPASAQLCALSSIGIRPAAPRGVSRAQSRSPVVCSSRRVGPRVGGGVSPRARARAVTGCGILQAQLLAGELHAGEAAREHEQHRRDAPRRTPR